MKRYLQHLHAVEPYVPGEQPNVLNDIKLNTNENPYPPSPKAMRAITASDFTELRLYPDPSTHDLNAAIAATYHVKEDRIFTGVGSDDVLAMIFQTFFQQDKPIFFPDITYAFYPVWCRLFQIPYETKPLDETFSIVPEDYFGENGGIVFPNPNAPTGLALPLSAIEAILQHNPDSLVVVDEAYVDFGTDSALPLLEKYENLLIVQTFSKSRSLAGARIAFAIGAPEVISALHDVKFSFNSYTINRLSLVAGESAIQDTDYLHEVTSHIIQTRERTKAALAEMGFSFPDSKANFLFVTHPDIDAHDLFLALRGSNIFVRWFDQPRIRNYLRITIGKDFEMDILFAFLQRYLNQK